MLHRRVRLWLELRLRRVRLRELSDGPEAGDALLTALVDNHRRFLAFLERRVGSRAVAEDLLQEALVRGLERAPTLRRSESATAWFYRVLRNALVDHMRKERVEARVLAAAAAEAPQAAEHEDGELRGVVCGCVRDLVDTLKPEYAEAIRQVELEGVPVRRYAEGLGITPNNAAVRLHRAREALRRQVARSCGTCATHECEECTCGD